MDFNEILQVDEYGYIDSKYAGKDKDGNWLKGGLSVKMLNEIYGQYESVDEMIINAESEGLKLFFQDLKDLGILN